MRKNKRGQVYEFLIVLVFVGLMLSAYFLIKEKRQVSTFADEQFGAKQKLIFGVYQEAEEEHFYYEMKFRYAWQKPVLTLAENGGFAPGMTNKCGIENKTYFWNLNKTEWCFEEGKIMKNLDVAMRNSLRGIFEFKYPEGGYVDYQIFAKGNQLVVISDHENEVASEMGSHYQMTYGFSQEMNYNFSEYEEVLAKARQLIDHCYAKPGLSECLDNDLKTQPFEKFQVKKCQERNCSFQVESRYTVWVYENNRLEKKPVQYKFALNFG